VEWEKAKSILLVLFILINVVLFGLTLAENRRYTLTAEREALVRSVLARHDITVETDITRRFAPMRSLRISGYYYNHDELVGIFFDDPTRVLHTQTAFSDEFTKDEAELFIAGGFITYINAARMYSGENNITREQARVIGDAFISEHFPDFIYDEYFRPHSDAGQLLVYHQFYRGHRVYSNFIELLVTPKGITEADMQFGRIHGWDGPERVIFAPDEVLLTFLQRVDTLRMPVTITNMDIVYFLEFIYASDERDSLHRAIPFYRIFIEGFEMPFLINAYTNVSID